MRKLIEFKILQYAGYASLVTIAFAVSIMLYWLYSAPTEAITLKQVPLPIVKTDVAAGDYVTLDVSYCKNTGVNGRVFITLVSDKAQLGLPPAVDTQPKQCVNNAKVPLPVPPQTTTDTYHFHFRVIYQINPLRSITQEWDTANFNVSGSPNQGIQGQVGPQGPRGVSGQPSQEGR